ncbi:MAG TPA: FliM/FliN family flagellar motor switch protein [Terriglobales bacterium]|nr:FliM/FliN family flagellar motor switch protein [Terriglobales bacterium]
MEKILTQAEIDAMVRTARGTGTSAAMAEVPVVRWDYRQAGRLGREQLASVSMLHEAFARSLTYSIGALLRTAFNVTMMSAEHLGFRDFLGGVPEGTFLASYTLDPFNGSGLIQLDLAVAYALTDILLGGDGSGATPARGMTEIEEQVVETAMHLICRELQTAWQALNVEFRFEKRQHPGEVQQLMLPEERILCLSFEVLVKERRGTMSIAVPTVISSALLRKLSITRPRFYTRHDSPDFTRSLRKLLLKCPFHFELGLAATASSAELADLYPGKVLVLNRAADEPAALFAMGSPIFEASLARVGNQRVAQVLASVEEERN